MNKKSLFLLIAALIATSLFYNQSLGLNVLLFEIAALIILWLDNTDRTPAFKAISIALLASALSVVFTNSIYAIVLNIITLALMVGYNLYPNSPLLTRSLEAAFLHFFTNPFNLIRQFSSRSNGKSIKMLRFISVYILPMFIILLFIGIYRSSNSIFDKIFGKIGTFIYDHFLMLFINLDFALVGTFIFCLLLCAYLFIKNKYSQIRETPIHQSLLRIKSKHILGNAFEGFKNAYKSGIFLFSILNIILLILNISDVYLVWFNFRWSGELLKGFVHDGIYLLLLSIVISIVLVLFYFRGNINFYSKNNWMKKLCYLWLLQNGILLLSVAIRNNFYIQHYALAYKRLGVIFFLVAALYGLYTVYIKVRDKKSFSYLLQRNSISIYLILLFTSFFNWDSIIAKYNFAHADKSYLHLSFLSGLSDKALPYLETDLNRLQNISIEQQKNFRAVHDAFSAEEFQRVIESRKSDFLAQYKSKTLLEWNWPEYKANQLLRKELAP